MAGGVNDVTIIAGILGFLILLGFVIPFAQSEFGLTVTNNNAEELQGNTTDASPTSAFNIMVSILNVVFWGFGVIPLWLNLFFLLLRLLVLLIIARNIWIGGGA